MFYVLFLGGCWVVLTSSKLLSLIASSEKTSCERLLLAPRFSNVQKDTIMNLYCIKIPEGIRRDSKTALSRAGN